MDILLADQISLRLRLAGRPLRLLQLPAVLAWAVAEAPGPPAAEHLKYDEQLFRQMQNPSSTMSNPIDIQGNCDILRISTIIEIDF